MNRFVKTTFLGSLGVLLAAVSSQKLQASDLEGCSGKAWMSECLSIERLIYPDSGSLSGRKVSLPSGSDISSLVYQNLHKQNEASFYARFPRLAPPASGAAEQSYLVRPRTGGQLYVQRVTAVQAGHLYSHITPDTFVNQWRTAWQQPTYQQWQNLLAQEAAMMAARQGNRSSSVLVGDSLYLWLPQEHLATDRLWLNQSISGETTSHILRRLHYFAHVRTRSIYVMVGINDLKHGVDPSVAVSNVELIAQRLRVQHPRSRIVILSILPTRLPLISNTTVQWMNQNIARAVRQLGVEFVDLQPAFMDSQGLLRIELTTDGIHLSPQGYRLLAGHLNAP